MAARSGDQVTDDEIRERIDVLAGIALFAGFSPEELCTLAAMFVATTRAKGETICREGEEGQTFFVVCDGELEIWQGTEVPRLLRRLGPGEFAGEMTLLLGGARTATVRVGRRATLLELDKASFDRFFGHNAKALENLSRVLCKRLVTTTRGEIDARSTISIGVVSAAPERRGRSLVSWALGGLLRDLSGRDALVMTVRRKPTGRQRAEDSVSLDDVARQTSDRLLQAVRAGGNDPAALTVDVPSSFDDTQAGNALTALLSRLGEAFAFVIVDPEPALSSSGGPVAEACDHVVALVTAAEALAAATDGAEAAHFAVVNLFDVGARPIALNHCLPFVLPVDRVLAGVAPTLGARRIRSDPWLPIARPMHRLARKILGGAVGLALGGGGAFGLAHVGVFAVLEDAGVPVDLVAGTSMGSIVALGYAAGLRARDMAEIAIRVGTHWSTMTALDFTLSRPGLLAGNRLVRILSPLFGGAQTFEDLRLPCRMVATDIECGERVSIGTGRLDAAFRASCSVPMLFAPVRHGDRVLVDGAVIDPVPAEVVHQMGADVCIAVNVVPPLKRGVTTVLSRLYRTANRLNPLSYLAGAADLPNMFDIVMNSLQILQCELGNFKAISADVRVNPDLSHLTWIEFYKPEEIIERERIAAEAALPEIRRVLAQRLPFSPRTRGAAATDPIERPPSVSISSRGSAGSDLTH